MHKSVKVSNDGSNVRANITRYYTSKTIGSRALIDQGVQSSFISERLCQFSKFKKNSVRVSITGTGGDKEYLCKSTVEFNVQPHFKSNFSCDVTEYVIPKITTYEPFTTSSTNWQRFKDITLADPSFGESDRIEILLGAQVHAQIRAAGKSTLDTGCFKTGFPPKFPFSGFSVFPLPYRCKPGRMRSSVNHSALEVELNTLLRSFREMEKNPRKKHLTEAEQEYEDNYKKTVIRTKTGNYEMRLPKKSNIPDNWGNSYTLAANTSQVRILQRGKELGKSYQLKSLNPILRDGLFRVG
ncbi:hypothetical protein TSAR_007794, partial [Trichomalopsis sarcophagae]